CAPLIHILHLRPALVDGLLQTDETIVTAANCKGSDYDHKQQNGDNDAATEREFVHKELRINASDYFSKTGVICEAMTFHSPPCFTNVSVHTNFPSSRSCFPLWASMVPWPTTIPVSP